MLLYPGNIPVTFSPITITTRVWKAVGSFYNYNASMESCWIILFSVIVKEPFKPNVHNPAIVSK